MDEKQNAFQINREDNVATALTPLVPGPVELRGVVIGRATADIPAGSWVHLHVMRSVYDQRSSHLDVRTGAPKDTKYE